ncbi:MAG: glycoside hydrolase family 127 protein [Pirellulales bacterium]|nr:glycoside hydrolase family 127 protein [Pirellulales bacterium]
MLRSLSVVCYACFSVSIIHASDHDYPLAPVPFTNVHFDDAFWLPRLEINRLATIPYSFQKVEEAGTIANFSVAGKRTEKPWRGVGGFVDSDLSKVIEGAAYSLAVQPDAKLQKFLDELIDLYAGAQEQDGYLYTYWTARDTVKDPSKVVLHIPEKPT